MRVVKTLGEFDPEIMTVILRQSEVDILTALLGNTCGASENTKRAGLMYEAFLPCASSFDVDKIADSEYPVSLKDI
jgi:hypothetical protein